MRARVPLEDRPPSARSEPGAEDRVAEHLLEPAGHFAPVMGEEVVPTAHEQTFCVLPRRGYERNRAGERLERPNRRNPRQRPGVGSPRDVHGHAVTRKDLGHEMVREPSAVAQPDPLERADRLGRIADAVDRTAQPELLRRTDQELVQLLAALVVTPVADPNQIPLSRPEERPEDANVCGFVPRPRAPGPPALEIEIADRPAEGEYAVVGGQVVARHLGRSRDGAVMRVVEEELERCALRAQAPQLGDEPRLVPLMDHDELRALDRLLDVELLQVVEAGAQ